MIIDLIELDELLELNAYDNADQIVNNDHGQEFYEATYSKFNEKEFKARFRVRKATFKQIIELVIFYY